jgi:asparagine synthase (glutamine-hydrolysing)
MYAEYGADMLGRLRGMFAFCLWDAPRQRLFMARDPYGIKPLYYADDGQVLRFASQVKALLAGGHVSPEPDPAGEVGFYLWGSIPEPFTSIRAIRALEAGCYATVDRDGFSAERYQSISEAYRQAPSAHVTPQERDEAVRAALLESVGRHLVADVPVGLFLSAGIDSGALLGLVRDLGHSDVSTITLSFEEFRGQLKDEAPLAAEVAAHYGARHHIRVVTEAEFRADLPLILAAMDQPSIDGLNTWFISKAASELGLKVAISGLGGDELFGGYPSFRDVPRWSGLLAPLGTVPDVGRLLRKAAQSLKLGGGAVKLPALFELGPTYRGSYMVRRGLFMPWELDTLLPAETIREGMARLNPLAAVEAAMGPASAPPFAKVAAMEASLYMRNQLLRDADWASMAHSLEVRVPLVDAFLLSRLAPLTVADRRPGKGDLAQAPSKPLPDKIFTRRKTGFATPVDTWQARLLGANQPHADRQPWARTWAQHVGRAFGYRTGQPSA